MTVNLTLDSFRAMVGKNNYGEVRLKVGEDGNVNGLEKTNNHFLQREWNIGKQKINSNESIIIRKAFLEAISNAGVNADVLADIRKTLHIDDRDIIKTALNRRTIAEVLNKVDAQLFRLNNKDVKFEEVDVKNYSSYFDAMTRNGKKSGVDISAMRYEIKQWNKENPTQQIKLSDDQLAVLFNRYDGQLKMDVAVGLSKLRAAAKESDQDLFTKERVISNDNVQNFERSLEKHFRGVLCEKILDIVAKDKLQLEENSFGVGAEMRSEKEHNRIRQNLEKSIKVRGLAEETFFMNKSAIDTFYNNWLENGNDGVLSDNVLFTPENFNLEKCVITEDLKTVEDNTVKELTRFPVTFIVKNAKGEEVGEFKFKYNSTNSDEIKSDNKCTLTALFSKLENIHDGFQMNDSQKSKLYKALGQKLAAAAVNGTKWKSGDKDTRKAVVQFDEKDNSFTTAFTFQKVDDMISKANPKMMEFDLKVFDNGDTQRLYLGPKELVEGAKNK